MKKKLIVCSLLFFGNPLSPPLKNILTTALASTPVTIPALYYYLKSNNNSLETFITFDAKFKDFCKGASTGIVLGFLPAVFLPVSNVSYILLSPMRLHPDFSSYQKGVMSGFSFYGAMPLAFYLLNKYPK